MNEEEFNYIGVRDGARNLEASFTTFGEHLKSMNDLVHRYINVYGEAIFGNLGGAILNEWDESVPTFGDFHANFEEWLKVINSIKDNQINYESNVSNLFSKHETKGGQLMAVGDKGGYIQHESDRSVIGCHRYYINGKEYYVSSDGNKIIGESGNNGDIWYKESEYKDIRSVSDVTEAYAENGMNMPGSILNSKSNGIVSDNMVREGDHYLWTISDRNGEMHTYRVDKDGYTVLGEIYDNGGSVYGERNRKTTAEILAAMKPEIVKSEPPLYEENSNVTEIHSIS